MSGFGDLYNNLMEQQATALKQYQDAMTETMKTMATAFGAAPPEPSPPPSFAPDAKMLADGYYTFASELLKRQHEFVLKLIEVMQPR